jgi:hypothetical protein
MARRSKMSVLKRQRERKKAEKAAAKREERSKRETPGEGDGSGVASREDLVGYGVVVEDEEDDAGR